GDEDGGAEGEGRGRGEGDEDGGAEGEGRGRGEGDEEGGAEGEGKKREKKRGRVGDGDEDDFQGVPYLAKITI
ncbi:MAG: hypothetical protein LBQ12_02885, partial [Deltaproteobacteria bacterium]|nr:hypothetical protein [Deltaproteobacteria bacterium]